MLVKFIGIDFKKLANWITNIFLIYMLTAFVLFLHDKYFDITLTRFTMFRAGVVVYGMCMLLVWFLSTFRKQEMPPQAKKGQNTGTGIFLSDIFMGLFLVSGFCAFLMAQDKTLAYTGEDGRRCGLMFIIMAVYMYFLLRFGGKPARWLVLLAGIAGAAACIIGILQHLNVDVFGLLKELRQYNPFQAVLFLSTFGNLNTFGSYLCMLIPLIAGFFLFEEKKWCRIIYAGVLFFCGGGVMAANSDLTYAGCGAALLLLLFLAEYGGRVERYLEALVVCGAGYLVTALLCYFTENGMEKLKGISVIVKHPGILVLCECILIADFVLCKLIGVRNKRSHVSQSRVSQSGVGPSGVSQCGGEWGHEQADKEAAKQDMKQDTGRDMKQDARQDMKQNIGEYDGDGIFQKRKKSIMLTGILLTIVMLTIIVLGVINKWSFFVFNDYWGNYRGFIWRKLWELYNDFPVLNKIFGYGNETIRALTNANIYEQMLDMTGTVYDNAHNEYLQYLVTTGIFGCASYMGLQVTCICNGIMCFRKGFVRGGKIERSRADWQEQHAIKSAGECRVQYSEEEMNIHFGTVILSICLVGYMVQGLFNVVQPITTPFVFVIAGVLAGIRRSMGQ